LEVGYNAESEQVWEAIIDRLGN